MSSLETRKDSFSCRKFKGAFSKEQIQGEQRKMEHKPQIFHWELKGSPMLE